MPVLMLETFRIVVQSPPPGALQYEMAKWLEIAFSSNNGEWEKDPWQLLFWQYS